MQIKDLPPNKPLGGVTFKHPETGESCIWTSQWQNGVWYKKPNDQNPNQVYPLHVESLTEAMEFEVLPV